ncbi:hypothetical protein [Acinetobacter sp. CFCC 10889]|uniref:hypothetical protein n=1 Tax=Acinetobacter sp. CFCC 10889 TaxID=1775557 RepID=UPI000DCFEB93|nr:hypothetical protein [Acinetobacter sp. CFCC 10889]
MKFKISALACSILCVTSLVACGGTDDIIDAIVDKVLPPMPEETIVSADLLQGRVAIPLQFVDAKTGEIIQDQVIIKAQDDLAQSNVYEEPSDQDSTAGYGYVYLKADAVKNASPSKPVKLRVILSSENYFGTSVDIIYTGTALLPQKISLVNKAAPPAGVAVALQKEVKADATGKLLKDIQLTARTTDVASKNAAASFNLPANTILKDEKGQALTGDLQVSIGYFSPKAENIGAIFPGGLNPDQVKIFENNQWKFEQGYFITAGLMAVDIIDSQGRKAHLLSNGQGTMTIQAPAGLLNPETNLPIKDGDTIPVWSHSESTGLWQKELVGTFKQNAQANFDVSYQVSHLSFWNLDWHFNQICPSILPIGFNKAFTTNPFITIEIDVENYGVYKVINIRNSQELTGLNSVPKNQAVTFRVKQNNKVIGQGYKAANSCNSVQINITEQLLPPREVPTQVYITAPKSFTKTELSTLLNNISSLSNAEKTAILKLTHPSNPNTKFTINQDTLKKFMDLGVDVKEIGLIQAVLSIKVQVSGYFWGLDNFQNIYNSSINQGNMTLFDAPDQDFNFKAPITVSYNSFDWATQEVTSHSYKKNYAQLNGFTKNAQGSYQSTYIPLKNAVTIKKTDTQATIIFEDISALQQIMKDIKK